MINLTNINVQKLLPSSINTDDNVKAIAKALDSPLDDVAKEIEYCLLLPRLDKLSENVVDELAWHYHVDFYEDTLPVEKKRNLIRQSIAWHRHKGTPWAVEQVVTTVFQSAKILEWFEYGAAPYHFKVVFIQEPLTDTTQIDKLIDVIFSAKNTRSWCDELNFLSEQSGTNYVGGYTSIYDVIEVNPVEYTPKNVVGQASFGGYTAIFEIVKIEERRNENG